MLTSHPSNLPFQHLALALVACSQVFGISAAHSANVAVQVEDSSGAPVMNAVVYAEPAVPGPSGKPAPASIEQKGKKFVPLVTVVQRHSAVAFPNRDSVRHHVYSFSPAKKFELKLYSGVPAEPVMFDKAGTAVLGCNIHDNMLAFVHIVDTPYFAKTDAAGNALLHGLPDGDYVIKAWHYALAQENATVEQKLVVSGNDSKSQFQLALKPFPLPK